MKCPACSKTIKWRDQIWVVNIYKFKCRACGTYLSWGARGTAMLVVAALSGLATAGVGIYMEETGQWDFADSLIWLACALPPVAAANGWVWCRYCQPKVRRPG